MQKLHGLTAIELHQATLRAAEVEKESTLSLLEYLAEVDSRRVYAERGYSSLWEYVHKAHGYSESQASERVTSMRLMIRVPEVRTCLEKGEVTLTSIAKIATHVRREKLDEGEVLSLVQECAGLSTREVEKVLVESAEAPRALTERVRPIANEVSRLTIDVDEEFLKLVERVKELGGNPGLPIVEALKTTLREYVRKRGLKQGMAAKMPKARKAQGRQDPFTRYIPVSIREQIRIRSGDRCEFVDLTTKRRCESRRGLEYDHVVPHSVGGANEAPNLRQVCRAHNLLHAIHYFGRAKMRPYLKIQPPLKGPIPRKPLDSEFRRAAFG